MANLRKQTRDILLDNMDCDCKPLPTPGGGYSLSVFTDMMFQVAQNNGYVGTKNEFEEDFVGALNGSSGSVNGIIIQRGSMNDFPTVGSVNGLYIDSSTDQIYYWKDGKYCAVFTELVPDTILECGGA